MTWQERITIDPEFLVGKLIICGTRISVEFVIELLATGWTVEQILKEYDRLHPEDIQAYLAYASEVLKSERIYPIPVQRCHESTMRVLASDSDWAGNFATLTETQIRICPLPPTRGIK